MLNCSLVFVILSILFFMAFTSPFFMPRFLGETFKAIIFLPEKENNLHGGQQMRSRKAFARICMGGPMDRLTNVHLLT